MQHLNFYLVRRQVLKRAENSLDGAMNIGFNNGLQDTSLVLLDLLKHLIKRASGAGRDLGFFDLALAEFRDFAGPPLAIDRGHLVACERCTVEPKNLDWHRGAGLLDRVAARVD